MVDLTERTVIEKLRRGCKISRKQLSILSGVNVQTLFNIERRGFKNYRKTTREKLAEVLKVPAEWL